MAGRAGRLSGNPMGQGDVFRAIGRWGISMLRAITAKGENARMPVVSRFIASNGRSVTKLVTPSGVTAYLADEVPLEALIGLRDQLLKDMGLPADHGPARMTPSRSNGKPGLKPR